MGPPLFTDRLCKRMNKTSTVQQAYLTLQTLQFLFCFCYYRHSQHVIVNIVDDNEYLSSFTPLACILFRGIHPSMPIGPNVTGRMRRVVTCKNTACWLCECSSAKIYKCFNLWINLCRCWAWKKIKTGIKLNMKARKVIYQATTSNSNLTRLYSWC